MSVFAEYWTRWSAMNQDLLDTVFLVTAPFLLITMLVSTLLGIAMLWNRVRPAASAWLLALTIPGLVVISMVTSLGNVVLPIMFAFGILGRRLAAADDALAAPVPTARLSAEIAGP